MASQLPSTRADLDALPEAARTAFMAALEGSIWRLQRDDGNQRWIAVEDLSDIERFNFTREDFPHARPPELPEWTVIPPEAQWP